MVLGAPEAIAFLTFAAQATKVLIAFYDGVKEASRDLKKLREELSSFCFLVTSLANLLQSSEAYSSRSGSALSKSIAVYLDNALSQLVQDLQEYGEFLHAMEPAMLDRTAEPGRLSKAWTKIKWVYGQKEAEKFALKLLRHKTSLSLAFAAAQSEQLHAIQQTMATAEKLDELLSMLSAQQTTLTASSTTIQETATITHTSSVEVVESVSEIVAPPPYAEPPPSYITSQEEAAQEEEQVEEVVRGDVKSAPSKRARKHQPAIKQSSKAVITRSDTHRFKFPFGELKVTLSDVTKNVSSRFTQKQYKVNFLFIPSTVFDGAVEGGWTSWRNLRGSLSVSPHLGVRKVVGQDSAVMKLAKSGDVEGMQRLFSQGLADTSDMTADGFTALHYAAQNAHVKLCRFLLDNACDVTATGPAGLTALHYAASWGQLEVVKLLVSTGKHDPTINDNFGFNALFQTLYSPHISDPKSRAKILRWLVEQDDFVVDLNERDINGRTPLAMAARVEPSTALLLIEDHANPHLTDNQGTTPLHNAAASGFAEVVDALISVNVDVNPRNVLGQTPLFLAVEAGHFPVVCRLLEAGASVNIKAIPADTELHKAAEQGRIDILERLLAAGGDPNVKGLWAENSLHRAAKKGHFNALKLMLEAGGDIEAKNEHGYTPLHKITWGGNAEMLSQLMAHSKRIANKKAKTVTFKDSEEEALKNNSNEAEKGEAPADLTARQEKKGKEKPGEQDDPTGAIWEELQTAIVNNNLPALKALLQRPEVLANINSHDRWGVSALLTAAKEGNAAMVELLISHGAEVEKQDWWGGTPLRRASDAWGEAAPGSPQNKFTEVIEKLLAAGANVDAQDDEDGYTSLHIAAANGHIQMVDFFLAHGASIQLRDWWGRTPVQIAAESRKFNAVNRLLDCGAKIEYRPDDKERLLLQKSGEGIAELVESYLAEGVDVNCKAWLGENPLRIAAESNQLKIVDILIKAGANVDIEDMWCRTPLRRAAERGYTECVARLLEEGPNVNIVDCEDSDTAMHRAAENGHVDSVRLLLENKADPTIRNRWGRTELRRANERSVTLIRRVSDDTGHLDDDATEDKEVNGSLDDLTGSKEGDHKGDTPLHRAAENGCLDVVNVILAAAVAVDQKGRFGDSPLHQAAERGHLAVVERLLKEKPDLTRKGRFGDTPALRAERYGNYDIADLLNKVERSIPEIHRAIQSSDTEALEEQLTCGIDPNLKNVWDETPLHIAAAEGRFDMARTLLENKCKVDAKTERGDTPLALAAANGHPKIVHLLLNSGANVNEKQRWGETALHRAAESGHLGIVDRLLRGGAEVNVKDCWQDTPLHRAAQQGHVDVVKSLLAAKADPRATGRWEDTALHRAAEYGHRQVLIHLLGTDINVNARDKWKNSALHLAAHKGHRNAVDILVLDSRLDTKLKNKQGKTPLDLAAEYGFDDVCSRLVEAGVTWNSVGEYRNSQAQASKAERKPLADLHFKMMKRAIHTDVKAAEIPAPELVMTTTSQKPARYPPLLASASLVLTSLLRGELQGAFSTLLDAFKDILLWSGAAWLVLTIGVFILMLERVTRVKPNPTMGNGTASESILGEDYAEEKAAKKRHQAAFMDKLEKGEARAQS